MSYLQVAKGYRPDGHVRADIPPSKQVLEWGKDHIVSFAGTSQFTALGVSACGLAAFNFARIAFRIEQNSENLTDVLNKLSTREVIEVSVPSLAVKTGCGVLKTIDVNIGVRKSWPSVQDGLVICI